MAGTLNTYITVALGFSVILSSCGMSKDPDLMTQACFRDKDGIQELIESLREVARSNSMVFLNRTEQTVIELRQIDRLSGNNNRNYDNILNIKISGNGVVVSASNIAFPGYQAVIGFSGPRGRVDKIYDKIIGRLDDFAIERIPKGQGAKPIIGC